MLDAHGKNAQGRQRDRNQPDRRERFDVHRRAGRRKEQDERRHRALFGGVMQHVAGGRPEVLNDQPGRQACQERLESERRRKAREHAAQHQQHDGDFATDDLQIQREQRAAQPRRTRWNPRRAHSVMPTRSIVGSAGAPNTARAGALADGKQHDHRDLHEDDDFGRQVRQRAARASFGDHGDRHRRRGADEQHRRQRRPPPRARHPSGHRAIGRSGHRRYRAIASVSHAPSIVTPVETRRWPRGADASGARLR